jgi:hypothetical protein
METHDTACRPDARFAELNIPENEPSLARRSAEAAYHAEKPVTPPQPTAKIQFTETAGGTAQIN